MWPDHKILACAFQQHMLRYLVLLTFVSQAKREKAANFDRTEKRWPSVQKKNDNLLDIEVRKMSGTF